MYDKTFPTFEEFQADEEFKSVLEQAEKAIESQAIHIVIERTTWRLSRRRPQPPAGGKAETVKRLLI